MTGMRRVWMVCCLVMLLVVASGVSAQATTIAPAESANELRDLLFDAQSALLSGDTAAATANAENALAWLDTSPFAGLSETLPVTLQNAAAAAEAGDSLGFAAFRSEAWAELLNISLNQTLTAVENGDAAAAQSWLALREFGPSTKFSRPGADAALAVRELGAGRMTAEAALAAVSHDLLDTYQTQLNSALSAAAAAGDRDFAMRRAEETGAARGYFAILSPMFAEQRADDTAAVTAAWENLTAAAVADDDAAFTASRAELDTLLSGFRAAPLTEAEAARRAGQLLRFTALVPVEYTRGVRDGQIVSDLEIQEALTFYDGALAAFTDLQSALIALDADQTVQIAAQFATLRAQIADVAAPAELQATADGIHNQLTSLMPEAWQNVNTDSDVDVILSVLDNVESAAQQGEYAMAESSRLEAYALMETGIEQRLRGFAPDLAAEVESLFWGGTSEHEGLATLIGNRAEPAQISATLDALRAGLAEGQALSSANSAPAAVAGNAAIIVFREGLEAVLILASLLASLRKAEERQFRRPLLVGAGLAFVASGITWWVANQLLTVLLPLGERLEAIVSLIAIGVLLIITNWFFHKVYWTGWMATFHAKKRTLIGGIAVVTISQSVGLIILGFTSIYREGFETVLFLQSLVLDAGMGVVMQGVLLGLFGVAIVGMLTFALQRSLPYKKMLIVTGVMIGFVLLTMVGNTTHVMQAVGWLPITPISGVQIPYWMGQWFGLYATWQGIFLQFVAGAFVIGSYFLAEHQNKQSRSTRTTQAAAVVTEAAVGD